MNTILIVIAILCLLVIAAILFVQPYDQDSDPSQFTKIGESDDAAGSDVDTQWRSCRVRPGLMACEHATKLTDQVFLAREIPELPLPECCQRDCACHYVFHDDRRSGLDRRAELAKLRGYISKNALERRPSPGRRVGDLVTV